MDAGLAAILAECFPPVENARGDGLLCHGGDLCVERLVAGYSRGIFPWYDETTPILWWSPDPRCVLPLEKFHLPRRSARAIRHARFRLTWDEAFDEVISACAGPRSTSDGTWLVPEMRSAYAELHRQGYAHSVEAWQDGHLVGGLYGVGLGRAFFGESMFHRVSEASRAALSGLVSLLRQRGVTLLDCQQETPHMMRMGARMIPRREFLARLAAALAPTKDSTGIVRWQPWPERYSWLPEKDSWEARS
ncbi:MAG: leucyl/phenylalanyl-tRNA--protein transferase [Desulfovibrio sp.]|nr:leucyl/phenylalanyl-tRNA--protein transferase [Desulfovibrio sp.]